MKNSRIRVLSFLLSFFILGATTSWTFATHYCGSIKVDTALFGTPDRCSMSMALTESKEIKSVSTHKNQTLSSCCHELEELVAGQKVFKQAPIHHEFAPIFGVNIPLVSWEMVQVSILERAITTNEIPPPPMGGTPLYICKQEFLI